MCYPIQDLILSIHANGLEVQVDNILVINILGYDVYNDIDHTVHRMGTNVNTSDILLIEDTSIVLGELNNISLSSFVEFVVDVNVRIDMDQDIVDLQKEIIRIPNLTLSHIMAQKG